MDGPQGPGRRTSRATIKDVAQVSGVSLATVSNVINGTKNVREETRRQVEDAIALLGYRPNHIARSLIARRTRLPEPAAPETRPRLIAVGYASIDVIAPLFAMPRPGERVTCSGIDKMLGGPATNVAVAASMLGEPFDLGVELITQLGDDADSDWALEELAARGVATEGVIRVPGARLSRCIVLVTGDLRRVIINEPLQVADEDLLAYLARAERPASRSLVHVEGFQVDALAAALPALRSRGYLMSTHATGLAMSWRNPAGWERIEALFDIAFLDREVAATVANLDPEEDEALVGAIDGIVQRKGRGLTVLTLGRAGAVLLRRGRAPVAVEGEAVEVVDTTGAGDAFAGVFLASWLTDEDAEAALRRANHAAALSTTALGALGRTVRASELPVALLPSRAPALAAGGLASDP